MASENYNDEHTPKARVVRRGFWGTSDDEAQHESDDRLQEAGESRLFGFGREHEDSSESRDEDKTVEGMTADEPGASVGLEVEYDSSLEPATDERAGETVTHDEEPADSWLSLSRAVGTRESARRPSERQGTDVPDVTVLRVSAEWDYPGASMADLPTIDESLATDGPSSVVEESQSDATFAVEAPEEPVAPEMAQADAGAAFQGLPILGEYATGSVDASIQPNDDVKTEEPVATSDVDLFGKWAATNVANATGDMVPAADGQMRLEVDGDYRLSSDDIVRPDDAGAFADALQGTGMLAGASVAAGAGGEQTAFLSGPPTGLSRRGRRVRIALVIGAVLITLFVIYVLGVQRFENRFLPNTSIYGCNVSGLTVEEAVAALEAETSSYSCDVKTGDFTATLTSSDVALERDEERIANEARAQQTHYAWPIALAWHATLKPDLDTTFNKDEVTSIISRAVDSYNDRTLSDKNASIAFNKEESRYELEGSVSGKAADKNAITTAALTGVRDMAPTCNLSETEGFHVALLEDLPDYKLAVDNANAVISTDIPILVDGKSVIESNASQNMSLISVADGPSIKVDEDALRLWAEDSVAGVVYHADEWSTYYLDADEFVSEFSARLSSGNVEGYEAPTIDELTREGMSRDSAYEHTPWDKSMGRYIDVDLTSQFARLFSDKGEVLWESAFVSGDIIQGRSTVEGIFSIYAMQSPTVLVGLDENGDGLPDYESFVNYWMPFYGGYGLHDATWRSAFGGDLYQYDGSHGCVNLPYEKAKELYGLTFVGEVVNVHW